MKPVKGLDHDTSACLASFINQDYPHRQILFGVADPADPVFPVLRELQGKHPDLDIQIINCPQELGLNPKVSTLRQLLPHADHELIVISDSDVRAKPDLLTRLAAALQQPGVGLATCLYRSGPVQTTGGALEALSISADFIPSVAMAHYVEGINFALGAVMALPRHILARIGGFPAIADYLADDYQLGYLVSQAGLQVHLLPYVVETLGRPGNGSRLSGPSVAVGENLPGLPPQRLFCLRHHLLPCPGACCPGWPAAWPPGEAGWLCSACWSGWPWPRCRSAPVCVAGSPGVTFSCSR